jgi:hypothetical protein
MIKTKFTKTQPTVIGYYLYMKKDELMPMLYFVTTNGDDHRLGVKINNNFFELWSLEYNGFWSEMINIEYTED